MTQYLAIAACLALGLSACATDPKTGSVPSASKEQETITGSRIPTKGTDRQVQSVSGEAWKRETAPVIGNQPRGN
jgi:type IV pilus biogenesis protein CpaD/CtpE